MGLINRIFHEVEYYHTRISRSSISDKGFCFDFDNVPSGYENSFRIPIRRISLFVDTNGKIPQTGDLVCLHYYGRYMEKITLDNGKR